jgi:hypothetical protein
MGAVAEYLEDVRFALNPCSHCGADFGGRELHRRHRAGRPPNKRCLTPPEMEAKGWWRDDFGRWRQRHGHARP